MDNVSAALQSLEQLLSSAHQRLRKGHCAPPITHAQATGGWNVLVRPGTAADTLEATWYRDASLDKCSSEADVVGLVPTGTCSMTFKVSAQSSTVCCGCSHCSLCAMLSLCTLVAS